MNPEQLGVLNALPLDHAAMIDESIRHSGADLLHVDGSKIIDKATLMSRFAIDLGMSADEQPSSWDGLADRLWGVLHRLSADHAVLVWTNADVLIHHSLADFLQAVNVLTDLARSVRTTDTGFHAC